jgi:hypothetical protein
LIQTSHRTAAGGRAVNVEAGVLESQEKTAGDELSSYAARMSSAVISIFGSVKIQSPRLDLWRFLSEHLWCNLT